jgi:hypothetical protein
VPALQFVSDSPTGVSARHFYPTTPLRPLSCQFSRCQWTHYQRSLTSVQIYTPASFPRISLLCITRRYSSWISGACSPSPLSPSSPAHSLCIHFACTIRPHRHLVRLRTPAHVWSSRADLWTLRGVRDRVLGNIHNPADACIVCAPVLRAVRPRALWRPAVRLQFGPPAPVRCGAHARASSDAGGIYSRVWNLARIRAVPQHSPESDIDVPSVHTLRVAN